jgi:two-component system sensor histidine kinase BaeS
MKLKLIHKLLIALFGCTALVLILITAITRASIGRDFVGYLQQQDRVRAEQLAGELTDWYGSNGSWDELANNPRNFYNLVFTAWPQGSQRGSQTNFERGPGLNRPSPPFLREGRRGPGPGSGPPGGSPGGPRDALHKRIFLLDSEKALVIGEIPAKFDAENLLPIEVNGAPAGWLGVSMLRSVELPEEEAFLKHQRRSLLLGMGTGLAIAALLAWLLARHLSQPISKVTDGIRALAAGEFNTRVETKGSDEIARLGDDVNRLSSALSEHETVRKRWMSEMAHELRTPLAIIAGELEAMSDGIRPLNKEQLDSVREEVKHLAALVDDLHKLALTDSGALAYKMQTVDLDELVQLTNDSFKGRLADKELELRYENPGQRVNIQGDAQRLHQLLSNLLDNSVRYTNAGGMITISLKTEQRQAQLSISDTAPGASAEECECLFERLYRPESSRNRNSGGSGLGLAICRNIVKAHGGQIMAEPGPDGGLQITTTLPLDI